MMKRTRYIFPLILLMPTLTMGRIKSETFRNIVALGNVLANTLSVSTDATINRNLIVGGNITAQNMTLKGSLNLAGGLTIPALGAGVVHSDSNGLLTSSAVVNGDIANSTIQAPKFNTSSAPMLGNFLGYNGSQMTWSTPSGAGNVSTTSDFTNANKKIVTTAGGVNKNIEESTIIMTGGNAISGVNTISATGATFDTVTMTGNIDMAGNNITNASVYHELGTAGTPSISFFGDTDTGIYHTATANEIAVTTDGAARLTINTATTTSTLPIVHPLGAAGAPSITFTGDTNTGIYSPGEDEVGLVSNGVEYFKSRASGVTFNLLTSTQSAEFNSDDPNAKLTINQQTPATGKQFTIYNTNAGATTGIGFHRFGTYIRGTSTVPVSISGIGATEYNVTAITAGSYNLSAYQNTTVFNLTTAGGTYTFTMDDGLAGRLIIFVNTSSGTATINGLTWNPGLVLSSGQATPGNKSAVGVICTNPSTSPKQYTPIFNYIN